MQEFIINKVCYLGRDLAVRNLLLNQKEVYGYFADSIADLQKHVQQGNGTDDPQFGRLTSVLSANENDDEAIFTKAFQRAVWRCFYIISVKASEKKYTNWTAETCPLKCGDVVETAGGISFLVTGVDLKDKEYTILIDGEWISLKKLLEDYTFNGQPCGTPV